MRIDAHTIAELVARSVRGKPSASPEARKMADRLLAAIEDQRKLTGAKK